MPERMILSGVYGSSTSKSSLSVLRGAALRCLSHCCEGNKPILTHPWSLLHHLLQGPIYFSLLCHLWKVLGLAPAFPCGSSTVSLCVQSSQCYCITKDRTCLSVPTVCSYIPGVCCTSHTRKLGVIWKPHTKISFHVADMGLSMDYVWRRLTMSLHTISRKGFFHLGIPSCFNLSRRQPY